MIGFNQFGRKQIKVVDIRELLVEINLSDEDYKVVLDYSSSNKKVQAFISAVEELKAEKLKPFWIPSIDPSEEAGKVIYQKGLQPAVGHSYDWWENQAKHMEPVDGKTWDICSEYQRYAFLVYLINQLVKSGWKVREAIEAVVINSKKLGHYCNSAHALLNDDIEPTGSRKIAEFYDLANTFKILKFTNYKLGGFCLAGGFLGGHSKNFPLAGLYSSDRVNDYCTVSVGVLVLS